MKKIKLLFIIFLTLFSLVVSSKELSPKQISQAYYNSYNYEKSANYKDAIKALQLVYTEYGKAYGVNNRLGYLYRLNKQYKNAENHYKLAISALPDALSPKLGLMFVYLQSKNNKQASIIGYQILSIDFYNYYGNLRLAYNLRILNKLDIAEKILIKMLVRYPSDVLYLTEFGMVKFNQKKLEKAASVMKEVLILDPENVVARSILLDMEK